MRINWKKVIKTSVAVLGTAFVATSIVAMKQKSDSTYDKEPEEKNPLEGKKVVFVENRDEKENADGARGHLEAIGDSEYKESFYEKYVKRCLDVVISFCGLVILSPVLLGIAIAIKIDDPGPVFFTQKRIGKNKKYFKLHKFRSMKMSTPHDKPTHMLENPEQYITRVGRFLRAHSLDGKVIIGTTAKSLENKGVREVSPIHFFSGRNQFSDHKIEDYEYEGMLLLA